MEKTPVIYTSFEPVTGTWQYIVSDPDTRDAVIIDSVLDFDPAKNLISTESADTLLSLVEDHNLNVKYILETHAHADHLTAAKYIQKRLFQKGNPLPAIGIGKRITQVQSTFAAKYGIDQTQLANVFNHLFEDNEAFTIGNLKAKVLHLPGHTPDHVGYLIGENVFTGDSIFNPDVGSARCDFPNGSATELYKSITTLLSLPPHYRLYTGHDYPPSTREVGPGEEKYQPYATVEQHRKENKHVKLGTSEGEFVKWRSERDATLGEPRLLHQALQFNIRGGRLPVKSSNGDIFLKVPLKMTSDLKSLI
ncbi:metallo-beta-lactamase superfamily protein [Xylogone sp. PMI_703]|nr:metallo-beta-lactamase superfamily protein [Xylogone sp. PMI_703]